RAVGSLVCGRHGGPSARIHAHRVAGFALVLMGAVATIERFAAESGIFALMNTAWAWPLAESLHFIGLSLLLGSVGVVDARLLGLVQRIEIAQLHGITRWGIAGFALNALTGFAFFVSAP